MTNENFVKNGLLGKYTGGAVGVYKCPADNFLSTAQKKAGWSKRLRSDSMNSNFGHSSNTKTDPSWSGTSWGYGAPYRQFLKASDVPDPSNTWVTIEEHPSTINDAFFICGLNAAAWGDVPASYHNGACGFSFADGHSEIHKWLSPASRIPVPNPPEKGISPPGFGRDNRDYLWYNTKVGLVKK